MIQTENFKEFLIYSDDNNKIHINVMLINNDLWLTQKSMAELFDVAENNITYHLQNIFKTNELQKEAVTQKIRVTANDGKSYNTGFYNLDAIISVGFRINSKKATQFRIWANKTLKEYIIKGFVMDDEKLKNPNNIFGEDYFEEQLERIRNIRSSERRFYQKITDIYASCSIDYDKDDEITKEFYQNVQNKLHFAVTGHTAPEIVYNRVDSEKNNIGLTTWKNAPKGQIYKYDVDIAKNYLDEKEINDLNRIVTMYLDYAENQAKRHIAMTMLEWKEKLNAFLQVNEYGILI